MNLRLPGNVPELVHDPYPFRGQYPSKPNILRIRHLIEVL